MYWPPGVLAIGQQNITIVLPWAGLLIVTAMLVAMHGLSRFLSRPQPQYRRLIDVEQPPSPPCMVSEQGDEALAQRSSRWSTPPVPGREHGYTEAVPVLTNPDGRAVTPLTAEDVAAGAFELSIGCVYELDPSFRHRQLDPAYQPQLDSAHQPYVGQRCVLVGQAASTGSSPRVTIRLLVEPYLELLVSPDFLRMLPDCTKGVTTVGACVYAWRRSRGVSVDSCYGDDDIYFGQTLIVAVQQVAISRAVEPGRLYDSVMRRYAGRPLRLAVHRLDLPSSFSMEEYFRRVSYCLANPDVDPLNADVPPPDLHSLAVLEALPGLIYVIDPDHHVGGRPASSRLSKTQLELSGSRCVLLGPGFSPRGIAHVSMKLLSGPGRSRTPVDFESGLLRPFPICVSGSTSVGACIYAWCHHHSLPLLPELDAKSAFFGHALLAAITSAATGCTAFSWSEFYRYYTRFVDAPRELVTFALDVPSSFNLTMFQQKVEEFLGMRSTAMASTHGP